MLQFPLKDTTIVPYGGYAVFIFRAENRGWWLPHSLIGFSEVEGMVAVIRDTKHKYIIH